MKRKPILWYILLMAAGFFPALLLVCGCEGNKLPKPTQDGYNTFGCKINGKRWVPDGGKGFQAAKPVQGGFHYITSPFGYSLGVYIRAQSKDEQEVHIYLDGYEKGEYLLNRNTQVRPASLNPRSYGLYQRGGPAYRNGVEYVTSSQSAGKVIITKSDTTTGVVAGTFEFVATSPKGDKVTITNGRFDVNYSTQ